MSSVSGAAVCTFDCECTCQNGVVDPGEDCDPTSPSGAICIGGPCNPDCSCPPEPTTTTITTTTTTITVATTSTTTTTGGTTTTTDPNHFQCYEIRRGPAAGNTVSLVDQFGSSTGVVLGRTNRLCAPVNKNGEDPTAPADPNHVRSYQVRHAFPKLLDQNIVNQFGSLRLDVVKPQFIFVPATKAFLAPPPAPTPPTADHFQCYKVRRHRGAPKFQRIRNVNITDQFGPATIELLKPRWLCAPVNKNNEDPTAPNHPSHLLCYKAKDAVRFAQRDAFLTDQFRSDQVFLKRRMEFCVPSLKNPVATTTTTTTTVATTTVTTTTVTTTTVTTTTVTTTSTTTTTTLYGSPSRAFVDPARSLLD